MWENPIRFLFCVYPMKKKILLTDRALNVFCCCCLRMNTRKHIQIQPTGRILLSIHIHARTRLIIKYAAFASSGMFCMVFSFRNKNQTRQEWSNTCSSLIYTSMTLSYLTNIRRWDSVLNMCVCAYIRLSVVILRFQWQNLC